MILQFQRSFVTIAKITALFLDTVHVPLVLILSHLSRVETVPYCEKWLEAGHTQRKRQPHNILYQYLIALHFVSQRYRHTPRWIRVGEWL